MTSKIYIIEDNEIMREMLVEFISDLDDMEVTGSAASAEEALDEVGSTDVDLLLVDMAMPKMNGAEFIEHARARWPTIPCLVLSAHGEGTYVERAQSAGAVGYVLKGDPSEISDAIRRVLRGEKYVSTSLISRTRAQNS